MLIVSGSYRNLTDFGLLMSKVSSPASGLRGGVSGLSSGTLQF